MKITWNTDVNAPGCPGEIVAEDGRTLLIQSDWDYPGTARSFGWDMTSVQKCADRDDFDYFAECGVWVCLDCLKPSYPCEVDCDECPECLGRVSKFTPCRHEATDGTVDCKSCGLKAVDFISAAYDWLRDNNGATAEDPGYFLEQP